MIRHLLAIFTLLCCGVVTAQDATEQPESATAEDIAEREAAFAKLLTNAQLRGSFTLMNDAPEAGPPKLKSEAYDLGKVRKLRDNLWVIPARIRYGDNDVTLPLTLPVEWAGDTPVIVVKNVGFPGLGTYSARVLFHGDRYAGYWQGAGYGGHLFGTIVAGDSVPDDPDSETDEAKPAE